MLRLVSPLPIAVACLVCAAGAAGTSTGDRAALPDRRSVVDVAELRRAADAAVLVAFRPLPGTSLSLVLEPGEAGALGGTILRGRVVGDPASRVRLVCNGDVVVGTVTSSVLGTWEIRPTGEGDHAVRRVDPRARAVCDGALLPPAPLGGAPAPLGLFRKAEPRLRAATIDVLVVYTPSSRAQVGGTPAIHAVIESHVDYANTAYRESGVAQRLRLVHAAEVAYVESGNSITDLARLRDPADGFMDDVHALRDAFGADCVSLINTSGSAGVAYLMAPVSPDFESSAFSAIGHDVGGLTFAHELGHNMGCGHDNGPGAQPAAFCYSYGHRTPDDAWRTIMASSPGTHVDLFSSPNLTFAGFPLGVPGTGCPPDAADNVRTLNATAATVASFRPTVGPPPCPDVAVPGVQPTREHLPVDQ